MALRLILFGAPAVARDGDLHALPFERRGQLVAHLACKRGWVPRTEAAALLWPGQEAKLAATNLRKALFRLQEAPWMPAIEAEGGALRLAIATDVADFEAALRDGRTHDALALRRGELLAGFDDDANEAWTDWLRFERDRLRAAWRDAALARLDAGLASAEALALSAQLLEADPLDEAALRAHVAALAASGQAARARQVARDFARRLDEELGVAPSARLAAWLAPPATPAPVEPVPVAPATDEGFVGRSFELRRVATMLASEDCRLVCLHGPGGAGKTRLAQRLLRDLAPAHPDGAHFVSLEDVASAAEVGVRLAAALGVPPGTQRDPIGRAIAHVRDGRVLVVLDNVEHVADCAPQLERLLAGCPRLRIVATSRVRLGTASEWLVSVDGLPCPEPEDGDRLEAFDASRLFLRAARRVRPDLDAAREAAAIVAICRAVEGLPLALQLAASWTRLLSCDAIARELQDGTELLHAQDPSRPARHASVEAVFDQSWRLLGASEREVLARLAVFRGGFAPEAARVVAGASLPLLGALVDKSLVRRDGPRLQLHPLVQQLAAVRLGAGDARRDAERAHARLFNDLLHQLRRPVENGDRDALRRVDDEFENCRAAWRWAAAHGAAGMLARGSFALTQYCDHRGRVDEGLALLEATLDVPVARDDPALRALLLGKTAHLQYRLDRYDEAIRLATAGLAITDATDAPDARTQCLKVLGACEQRLGRHAEALRHLQASLDLAPACSDPRHAAISFTSLALVHKGLGDFATSERLSLDALGQFRRLGDFAGEALALNNLAALHIEQFAFAAAAAYLEPALALCERHGLVSTRGSVLTNLTLVAMRTGRPGEAEAYAARAFEQGEATGNRFVLAYLRFQFARFALARGDLDAARAELRTGLELAHAIGRQVLRLEGILCFAEVLAAQGDVAAARSVAGFVAEQPLLSSFERDDLVRRSAAWDGAGAAAWPGLSVEALAQRAVVETDVRYAPLVALLAPGTVEAARGAA